MTKFERENTRKMRVAIITKTSKTELAEAITHDTNYFSLPGECIDELLKYAKVFNYKQSESSKNNGISYLRSFYYYLRA